MQRCKKLLVFKFFVVLIVGIIFNTLIICHYFIRREPFLYENTPIINISDKCKKNSFPLESSYNNTSGTGGKEFFNITDVLDRCKLPHPFCNLKVKKTKGSSGKCWVFHKSVEGVFKGYIFPGGFRIMVMKQKTASLGEFFRK